MKQFCLIFLASISVSTFSLAFENTKTLPKGVRNLSFKNVFTNTSQKTDRNGNLEPLAQQLWKPLKYRNILAGEKGLKRTQLEAFLISQGISKEDSVGDFSANLNANINVIAPIIAYGLTDRLTVAIGIPYYSASTDIKVGFESNKGADNFIAALTNESMNNYQAGTEAAEKFKNATLRLNNRLVENSYSRLAPWTKSGLGDITLATKYLAFDKDIAKIAVQLGFVAPTGIVENPDILTDLSFGDGQWDFFTGFYADEFIGREIFINQFVKYAYQAPFSRPVRWKTDEETIEAPKRESDIKLGDKIDAGISLQYEQESTGITGGFGALVFKKFGDRYYIENKSSRISLERDTDQNANYLQIKIGYSTLPGFRRKEISVPVSASFEYRKQIASRNIPATNFSQFDLSLFF